MPLPNLTELALSLQIAAEREGMAIQAASALSRQKKAFDDATRMVTSGSPESNVVCYLPADLILKLRAIWHQMMNGRS